MALWFHGIQLNDDTCGDIIQDLASSQDVGVNVHTVYGSANRDLEITGIDGDDFEMDIILGERWSSEYESTQHLISLLRGIVARLHPIHLYSDTVTLFEGSNEVFVAIKNISYDYEKGKDDTEAVASVKLRGEVIGTPATMRGKVVPTVVQRQSDFEGIIAPRSVIGLPAGSLNTNVPVLETREATTIINMGDSGTGFADDSLASEAGEAQTGVVTYELDTAAMQFLSNGCTVWDEGYTPRRRVISRHHQFTGSAAIETDAYRIVINRASGKFEFYAATSPGVFEVSPFEILTLRTFSKIFVVAAQEEFVRLRTNAGDFVEIERGKDPIIIPGSTIDLITYEVGDVNGSDITASGNQYDTAEYDSGVYSELRTEPFRNYIELGDGSGVWVSSNFNFTIPEGTKTFYITTSPTPVGGVYQLSYSDVPTTGRNREVLKQITG